MKICLRICCENFGGVSFFQDKTSELVVDVLAGGAKTADVNT